MPDYLLVEDYQIRSALVVPEHEVPRARFPVIDAHHHITHTGVKQLHLDTVPSGSAVAARDQ